MQEGVIRMKDGTIRGVGELFKKTLLPHVDLHNIIYEYLLFDACDNRQAQVTSQNWSNMAITVSMIAVIPTFSMA